MGLPTAEIKGAAEIDSVGRIHARGSLCSATVLTSREFGPSKPRLRDFERSRLRDGVPTLENLNHPPRATGPGRAVNLNAPLQAVAALCEEHAISISTIEPLQSGGTRVVLNTAGEAENLRRRMKGKLIEGPVVRSPLHVARKSIPYG